MNTIDITAANTPAAAAEYKGMDAILTLADGTTLTGTFLSVNSKGWNITVDGKTISRGLKVVAKTEVVETEMDEDTEADFIADMVDAGVYEDDTDEADNAELEALVSELDGATTAELAEVFGMAAKELRVHLRALGMGVGKGHRYHLTADQIKVVRDALTPTA